MDKIDFATLQRGTTIASSTQSFTATQAGFYTFKTIINTNNYGSSATVKINGTDAWRFQWNSITGNYNIQFTEQLFICKGDIITTSTSNGASFEDAKFTPLL